MVNWPVPLVKVLKMLEEAGFEAYVVGGAVRDYLLGKPPVDLDVATSARPQEVLDLVVRSGLKAVTYGAAFGVVGVLAEGGLVEVATFRSEVYGEDPHRPEKVDFLSRLEEDLARRDFTINAMAMDLRGKLYDPFGGQEDLRRGIIRAVGDPVKRFQEDALRAFRACRFAAQLGYRVEPRTRSALSQVRERVARLSVERVRDEIERILVSDHPDVGFELMREAGLLLSSCRGRNRGREEQVLILPEVARLYGVEQNPRYHRYDVWSHTMAVLRNSPPRIALRWAALLHDVAKGLPGVRKLNRRGELCDHRHEVRSAQLAARILRRLRVRPQVARRAVFLVRCHMFSCNMRERTVIRWLGRLAADLPRRQELEEALEELFALRRADLRGGKVEAEEGLRELDRFREMVKETLARTPFYPSELALAGKDLVAILGEGPQIGKVQRELLREVQSGRLPNEREALWRFVEKRWSKPI
ncbi:CCA tRNA nucleotidyltransferase [Ammonifex thiophilus]|uniref:CCA tRNA nucleotidyltransferase n=1 Tax=Ammonifex thiophilus TaxID=444093 RepID=UPI001F0BF4EC|nr:HD domain-containing protein [Ammonifex thiophilus]